MRIPAVLLAAVLTVAWVEAKAIEATTGSATQQDRISAPSVAAVKMRPVDMSSMDAPTKTRDTVKVNRAGNPPGDVVIPDDRDALHDERRFAVQASLRIDGSPSFSTDPHTPAVTGGAGTEASITLVQAQDPAEMPRRMIGEFVYFADAATFRECGRDDSHPVAMEGLYLDAERGYATARSEPMAPAIAVLDGKIVKRKGMEGGMRDMLVIDRLAGFVPGMSCERAMADPDIADTYWRILSIGGGTLEVAEGQREPHVVLRSDKGAFSSTIGCNTINGSFTIDGSSLRLNAGPMTMMACPPPLDEFERAWIRATALVSEAIVTGPTLELRDAQGQTVAFLEAVALP